MDYEKLLCEIADKGKTKSCEEWLEKVKQQDGSVPLIFQRMAERPEVLLSHLLYKSSITETSTLDPKYVELISLAVGAALNCRHCTEYHMRAALKRGATKDEILEVVLLAGTLAQSSVLADAYRVIDTDEDACNASCDINGFSYKKE
ncbi:AhpD family alkylhydroperoxidase [Methanomicrobium sp. W14]|uniref:carboxymuconolactone decarboxylase family protein n=1 Tax=Methanomicrobium sp. W14 TaxID=2817839 RepID=UPI001AEB5703|nr:carboxymuconolactone decarboxylase family protein [Methanomicrobium sp. W14]MBP2132919.1 AhpD family alkylhydroperoxidase [Methanomicrobium sp. W14]